MQRTIYAIILLVMLMILNGCIEYIPPPSCYNSEMTIENIQEWPELKLFTGYVQLVDTRITTTTVYYPQNPPPRPQPITFTLYLNEDISTQPQTITLSSGYSNQSELYFYAMNLKTGMPEYPNCNDPFPTTQSFVIPVENIHKKGSIKLNTTHVYNQRGVEQYQNYEAERNRFAQRNNNILICASIIFIIGILITIYAVWVTIKAIWEWLS